MKSHFLLIGLLFLASQTFTCSGFAQTIYPDGFDEPVSDAMMFVENDGQLLCETQWMADVIQYYAWGAPGGMFFTTSNFFISAMKPGRSDTVPDTLHRLDMAFGNGANEVDPVLLTPVSSEFRYYQHNGTFTDLDIGKRLVYEDLYTDVDVHFYSNEYGPKTSIVFENGANPSVFALEVDGYDYITEINNYLIIHKDGFSHVIPEGIAYEVDAMNNVNLLSWRPEYTHDGNGNLTFSNLGSWDNTKTLIFQFGYRGPSRDEDPEFVDWCTLFGGGEYYTKVYDLNVSGNDLYVGGVTTSELFPATNTTLQDDLAGDQDLFFAQFDGNHVLQWATFLGGSGQDGWFDPFRFDLKSDDHLMIATTTQSTDFPLLDPGNGAFFDNQNTCGGTGTNCQDAVIVEISDAGSLVYSTYFGQTGNGEQLRSLVINGNDQYFVVGSGGFPSVDPGGGAYFSSSGNGRVAQFDSDRSMIWSTYFGSSSTQLYDCVLDQNDNLLITGFTGDYTNFPIQNMAGAYNQSTSNGGDWEGIIAQFDGTDLSLDWSTFIGGDDEDKPWDIDVSVDNEVAISGHTLSDASFPTTASGSAYNQSSYGGTGTVGLNHGDGFLAKLDTDRDLVYCSYFGDDSSDEMRDITFHHNYMIATGVTGSANNFPFSSTAPSMMYVETTHSDGNDVHTDGYVTALINSGQELYWTTYLGSEGSAFEFSEDELFAVELWGLNKLYVGGDMISHTNVPFQGPGNGAWFQSTTNSGHEGFICLFDLTNDPLAVDDPTPSDYAVYPNPFDATIAINVHSSDVVSVSLVDMQGRQILSEQRYDGPLNLEYLDAGLYLLKINSGQNIRTAVISKH